MATRKLVPRADNEGGLGTALKRWASAFVAAITCTTINALTLAAAAVGFTIAGGTTSKTLTVDETGAMSSKLTLAIGAANLKAFMNAGATAAEFSAGFGSAGLTRNMNTDTGDVSYTGMGFKPAVVIIFFGSNSTTFKWSMGFSSGTTNFVLFSYSATTSNTDFPLSCVWLQNATTADYQKAKIKSFDADGFTLTWTKGGSPGSESVSGYALCLR